MKSFISISKSPCISRPDKFGAACKHVRQNKNEAPCCDCDLPRAYDDSISFGIKRYTDKSLTGSENYQPASNRLDEVTDMGYRSVGEMIESLHSEGYSYESIANMVGVSKKTVLSNKWRD